MRRTLFVWQCDLKPKGARHLIEALISLAVALILSGGVCFGFEHATYFTLGILFWIILSGFVAVIVLDYLHGSAA
jgi:hypothetical protein